MYSNWNTKPASEERFIDDRLLDQHLTDEHLVEEHLVEEHHVEGHPSTDTTGEILSLENYAPPVGRNCRINIIDKHEIVRLNEELQDLQRWFEEYGQEGILFPNSVINAFQPKRFFQAA